MYQHVEITLRRNQYFLFVGKAISLKIRKHLLKDKSVKSILIDCVSEVLIGIVSASVRAISNFKYHLNLLIKINVRRQSFIECLFFENLLHENCGNNEKLKKLIQQQKQLKTKSRPIHQF